MKFYFYSLEEYYQMKGLPKWLHECVDPNIKGDPYEYWYYSDGSSSWAYKSKNHKWEISKSMNRVTITLDEQFEVLYSLRWA